MSFDLAACIERRTNRQPRILEKMSDVVSPATEGGIVLVLLSSFEQIFDGREKRIRSGDVVAKGVERFVVVKVVVEGLLRYLLRDLRCLVIVAPWLVGASTPAGRYGFVAQARRPV